MKTQKVSFKTSDGVHFLCAEPDGYVVANRTQVGPWEEWTVEHLGGGKVALKSAHGLYLCAEPDDTVVANRAARREWETWTLVLVADGVGFEDYHGKFLVAEGGGGGEVRADREYSRPGPWETFVPSEPVTPGPGAGAVRPLVGLVRTIGESFGDSTGPRIVHGCTDFGGVVKHHENRDALLRQLDVVARHQQFVRVAWRLNGWKWATSGLTIDPIRDAWYDDALRGYLTACDDRGLRVDLTCADMFDWTAQQAEDSIRRVAQIAASVSQKVVWLHEWNEMRVTWPNGENEENIARARGLTRIWEQHYPWSMRGLSDPANQAPDGMVALGGNPANVHLIHGVRWPAEDAIRRAFNIRYEGPDNVVEGEPTGPNGDAPPGEFTRLVYQPTEDHDVLLAIYTMHVLSGQVSTYFSDPALVSRRPLESTWGFTELPAFWRMMEIPENVGQGELYHGGLAGAPLEVNGSNAQRADSVEIGNYCLGVISGGSDWRVRAGRSGMATAYRASGVAWTKQVSKGEVLPESGPKPTVVRIVT